MPPKLLAASSKVSTSQAVRPPVMSRKANAVRAQDSKEFFMMRFARNLPIDLMDQSLSDVICLRIAILDESHTTDPILLSQTADSIGFRAIRFILSPSVR